MMKINDTQSNLRHSHSATTNTNAKHWQTVASYFERNGLPLKNVNMTVEVYGIYSIPEEWIKLEQCGSCDTWPYQLEVSGVHFTDGKFFNRELTDEEKKELEAKNTKRKTVVAGKNKQEEISKDELERIERERAEKEEKERLYWEEFNALDERGRFYKRKETPTEEPWVAFPLDKNINHVSKEGEDLIILEEDINDNKGFYIEFSKQPPPEWDPKKAPKQKNLHPDEVKPFYCVGWADLTDFHQNPGLDSVYLRVPLKLKETNEYGTDYVQSKETYVYLRISFDHPVNPPLPEKPLPEPFDLIKKTEHKYNQISAEVICNDFKRQLKVAIEALCKV